jgi:hypothetical protein
MKTNFILFAVLFSTIVKAQDNFTYISDRKFYGPEDLIGYDFRPEYMEIPNETETKLSPGAYSFGISRNNLYVNGDGIKGVYSVNNINPTEYGFKLLLMNARDPTLQGHLKVVLTRYGQVEALVFKRSTKDKEIIFYQAQMADELWETEKAFFTYKYDYHVSNPDSLWGEKFYPFLRIHQDQGGVQERLQMDDSTSIEFVERITVVEKKKKKKGRKKDKEEIEETVVENLEGLVIESDAGAMPPIEAVENDTLSEEEQLEVVKVKIVKEYFVIVRSILTYDDGTIEDKTWEIEVKNKFTEYQRETVGPNLEPFELVLSGNKKGEGASIFLTKKRTISSINVLGKKFLMRGH